MDLRTATEQELREFKVPFPATKEELDDIIDALAKREHTYGTCVYAMSIAATATFNYISHQLGVTGFQASCADLDVLRRTRHLKSGFKILDFEKLLYPQYCNEKYFPSWETLMAENIEELGKKASELLETENGDVHPNVANHRKEIVKKAMLNKIGGEACQKSA